MAKKGILLNDDNDLLIVGKRMVVGNSQMQEVAIILEMTQGSLKFSPVLGADIIQLIKANASSADITRRARIHLEKDGKNYDEIKNKIKTLT